MEISNKPIGSKIYVNGLTYIISKPTCDSDNRCAESIE